MTQLILSGLFLFIVAISALVGLIRGMNKSIIRIITFVFAIILTFCISVPVTNLIADNVLIEGQTLGELLLETARSEETVAGILNEAPLLEAAILVLPAFAIAILVFPLVFFLLSFISWIVFLCIQKPLRRAMFKETFEKRTKNEKTVEEIESSPVAATEAEPVQEQNATENADETNGAQVAVLTETAEPVSTEEPSAKSKPSFGVRFGKRMAGLGIGAVIGVLIFGMIFSPLLGIFSVLPENNALNEAIDTLVEQKILEADIAEIIKTELTVRESGLFKLYGIVGITFAGKTYLSSASKFEAEGLKSNIPAEFDAIFSVAQTAIESGMLKALMNSDDQTELFAVLSNQSVMDEMMQSMLESKLFRSAVPKIAALAIETVAQSLKVPANKEAVYNDMMDDIAAAVKESNINYEIIKAYEDSLVAYDAVDFTDADNGAQPTVTPTKEEYEAEIAKLKALEEKIAKIINTSVSGSNETVSNMIAEQILMNIEAQALENGSDVLRNFTAEDVKATVSAISENNARTAEASLSEVLEKMNDPEKFETDVATVETISASVFDSVSNAVADDSKSEETASTLANVVSNFAGAVSEAIDENGQMDVAKLNFEKIADAVTTLQNSTLKDVGSSVLDIMISGELGDNEMISNAVIAVKESYDNGENISGTINSAGALIVLGTTMSDGSTAAENIAESFTTLVKNLDETTMKLLPSILSDETLAALGVAEKYREIAYNSVESLLRELMALKNSDSYEQETNTILAVYDILTSGKNNIKEQVSELITYALQSEVIVNTLNKVANEVLKPEMFTALGITEEAAENAYDITKTFLNEIKISRQNGSYHYEDEAFTMNFIYNLSKEGLGNITEEDIQTLAESAKKSDAVYNTLTSISESNPFGLKITNTETRTNLIHAIENAFAESQKTEKDTAVFNAIAKVLGLDAEINLA